jgi:methionine-gamma-lyase
VSDPSPPSRGSRRFDPLPEWVGLATQLIHGGRRPERNAGAVVPPIYQTSTFHFPGPFSESADERRLYMYTRLENPTLEVADDLLRRLEGTESARVFGSGMGAIATTLLTFLRSGDEVVALDTLYGGSLDLLSGLLPRLGVRVRWVSAADAREPERAVRPSTKFVLIESPTNPLLQVTDLRRWSDAAHAVGALLAIDNTFATPVNQRPATFGVDLMLHSGTKYLGGHADLLAGAVAGREEHLAAIDETHAVLGSVLDPFAGFLLVRGLRTLALRVERQNTTGARLAARLAQHPRVESVHYPGLGGPEQEAIAARQMRGRGGMVSIAVRGGSSAAHAVLRRLQLVHVAGSLGGVESLVSVPSETSHRHLSAEQRAERGIVDGLLRFSFGIEEPADLERDLVAALDGLARAPTTPPL